MKRYILPAVMSAAMGIVMSTSAWAGELSIHGSTTVYSNIFKKHEATIEQKAGVQLNIIANGSGRGILDLIDGKANMAMISAPLETAINKINKKEPGRVDAKTLMGHEVASTQVAFITHASNPVKELTLAQVKDILLGKIKNWSEVGGQNKPIIVVSEDSKGGIRALVEKKVLGKVEISAPGKKEVPNGQQSQS